MTLGDANVRSTLGFLLITLCIVLLAGSGFRRLLQSVRLSHHGRRTRGKVVNIEMEDNGDFRIRWVSVAYAVAGQDYVLRYWTGRFRKGQEVNLLYDSDNPRNGVVVDWTTMWLVPLLMLWPLWLVVGIPVIYGMLIK